MAFKFEKLKVWQKAVDLSDSIDQMTTQFPKSELFILTSQIKRAADSVSLNIAEAVLVKATPNSKDFRDTLYGLILKLQDVYILQKEDPI